MTEITSNKKGINSFTIRIIGYVLLSIGLIYTFNKSFVLSIIPNEVYFKYLSWIAYPLFAFLLSVGFEETSDKLRYFLRLFLFALVSELPYNLLTGGKLIDLNSRNGMFTLTLGYVVIFLINLISKKVNNIIITGAATYILGYWAYKITKICNFEFYTFGIMFIIIFYISRRVKFSKLFTAAFFVILVFYIQSNASMTFIIGNVQYSVSYRVLSFIALFITYFYNEKRGPDTLAIKVAFYAYYPAILLILYIISLFAK